MSDLKAQKLAYSLSLVEQELVLTNAPLRAGDHYFRTIQGLMEKGVLKFVYPIQQGTLIPLTEFGWSVRTALKHYRRLPPPQEGGE